MNPRLIGALVMLGVVGVGLALARQRRAISGITADTESFAYYRNHVLVRRVLWQSIAQIRFEREEVTDDWMEAAGSWLEERWVIAFKDGAPPLTILNVSPIRESWIAAATRYIPGFRADTGLLTDPGRQDRVSSSGHDQPCGGPQVNWRRGASMLGVIA